MAVRLDASALDQLFLVARSTHAFTAQPVTDETLRELYQLLKWGPTAFNSQPARYVFVRSPEAKARLAPALSSSNRDKTLAAPVTVIVAFDVRFFEHLGTQWISPKAGELFTDNVSLVETTAIRNGSLQGAYLILAARALGLGVGPMSGFNGERVDTEFFPDGRFRANFLANLGFAADGPPVRARGPRLEFEQVARIL